MKANVRKKDLPSRGKEDKWEDRKENEGRKKCGEVEERLGEGCAIVWHRLFALVP